jgi:hypothetical protein
LVSKAPTVLPRAGGLGGRQFGLGASRAVVAGVGCGGGAVTALESPARVERGGVRGTACAGCALAPGYLCWGAGLEQRRGDAVAHGGARLGAMGGSEGGVRGRLTRVCECVVRDGQVRASAVAKGSGVPFPPFATAHGALGHDEAAAARTGSTRRRRPTRDEERLKRHPRSTRARAGVHGDAVHRVCGVTRERKYEREHERGRERERLGARGDQRRHGVARPRTRRASVKAAAPARKIPAWLEGQPHWRRRGGAGHDTFHPARWPGASTSDGRRLPSTKWPRAEAESRR